MPAHDELFRCPRCAADPQPPNFGSSRKCAFTAAGLFTPENWNCATIDGLLDLMDPEAEQHGSDESMQIVSVVHDDDWDGTHGWIVLNRYKHRGCTSSAMHVGDFWPANILTYTLADSLLTSGRMHP